MKKSKINLEEIEKDIDKILKFVENIESNQSPTKMLKEQSKVLKENLEKKYKDYLDSKE
jgi:hypothetical protein